MKLPPLSEIEFSPLLWKEFLQRKSSWKSIKEFYPFLVEKAKEIDYCKGIQITTSNVRAKRLVNGYVLLDLLKWDDSVEFDFKFWQFFEDLIGELFREFLKTKKECTVVYVDKVIKGLDFVITNTKCDDGWQVGIQCKRYIGSTLPKCKLPEVCSWSKGTSAAHLIQKGHELNERWGSQRKFALVCFNAFRNNLQQQKRFAELQGSWDKVVAIDKSVSSEVPYTYKIDLSPIEKIIQWC